MDYSTTQGKPGNFFGQLRFPLRKIFGSNVLKAAKTNPQKKESGENDAACASGPGGGKDPKDNDSYGPRGKIGLFLGPGLFLLFMLLVPVGESFTASMRAAAASTIWIAVWWVTEAIPIPATSLLPLVLFPLTGTISFGETTVGYANPNVFLFLGGFMLAVTMQRWNLHRRLALAIISVVGTDPSRLILGFMLATGILSMWISNTATAMMMLPIGLAVILQVADMAQAQGIKVQAGPGKFPFGTALMLGIAYSASVGGVGTLIGTPPNAIFASVASSTYGIDISFAQWLLYGLPLSIIFLFLSWFYLIKFFNMKNLKGLKGGSGVIDEERKALGPVSKAEALTGIIFLCVALAWITRSFLLVKIFPDITDHLIAVLAVIFLFITPVDFKKGKFLLDWDTAVKIPWGILLLFGGGISIASSFSKTGLDIWIGGQLGSLEGMSIFFIMLCIVTLVVFLSNVTSNTGTVSMMLPVMVAMAIAMQVHPFGLMIAATTAASFAFMLPVGTPPNAVVFGSGYISIPEMARTGFILTLITIILVPIITYFWIPIAWGIDLSFFPAGWL